MGQGQQPERGCQTLSTPSWGCGKDLPGNLHSPLQSIFGLLQSRSRSFVSYACTKSSRLSFAHKVVLYSLSNVVGYDQSGRGDRGRVLGEVCAKGSQSIFIGS